MKTVLINGKIILPYKLIERGFIVIEDGKIKKVGEGEFTCEKCNDKEIIDVEGKFISPGFIDQHIHGAANADAMDANVEAIQTIQKAVIKEGTTSFLATTMTELDEAIVQALEAIIQAKTQTIEGAQIVGIHLEGPFIDVGHKGAQRENAIQVPSIEAMKKYMSITDNGVRLVTYAIEHAGEAFTQFLRTHNITASVGHSGATFFDVEKHVAVGLNNVTHFHNASSAHTHRNPGVVSAGFYFDQLMTELIVDGIHLHPDTVRVTYKIKGADKICLITDAMRAKGMPDGTYDLGGQAVYKRGNEARLAAGNLAGSVLEMNDAVYNMMQFTGCSIVEAVRMASFNPAKQIGMAAKKGSLASGLDADIIVFDKNIRIEKTFVAGKLVYQR